jgi:hypothetical protein
MKVETDMPDMLRVIKKFEFDPTQRLLIILRRSEEDNGN